MAKQKKSKMALYTRQDKIILYCGYALLGLFLLAIIVPMIYIVIASFMDPVTLQNKGISFDFSKWSLDAYQRVVSDKQIWVGFRNAVLYSIIFTIISVAVTMLAAYHMSLPDFKGKKIFNTLFVITMFFSGGLIPTYLLINNLGLLDSMWAVILPGLRLQCAYTRPREHTVASSPRMHAWTTLQKGYAMQRDASDTRVNPDLILKAIEKDEVANDARMNCALPPTG